MEALIACGLVEQWEVDYRAKLEHQLADNRKYVIHVNGQEVPVTKEQYIEVLVFRKNWRIVGGQEKKPLPQPKPKVIDFRFLIK